MAPRLIRVRYAGNCSACKLKVPAKSTAWWDSDTKTMTCESCGTTPTDPVPTKPSSPEPPAPAGRPIDEGPIAPGKPVEAKPPKSIKVRYDGACADCGCALLAKSTAWWDPSTRTMRCPGCGDSKLSGTAPVGNVSKTAVARPPKSVEATEPAVKDEAASAGPISTAGGSAQREYERRKAKREDGIRARHPHVGGLILALWDDPQSTTAWARGAAGERKLGAGLDGLADAGVVALHDRLIPRSKANIDHIAVAPSGVWVIDAKRYTGQVAKRDVGGWLKTDLRLYVGRRDCTKLVAGMAKQVMAVRSALAGEWTEIPVQAALCFVDADWKWFAKPFRLDGVLVTWPRALREMLTKPGPYTPEGIERVAAELGERLRPAT